MHRVRAYTFDFCSFFIYYICGFTKEFMALGSLASEVMRYRIAGLCVKFGANPLKL